MAKVDKDTCFLFGNGLSLAFNQDHYALPEITTRVRNRLSELPGIKGGSVLDDLEWIARTLERDDIKLQSTTNFEDIAGPIDRLANALPNLLEMARLSNDASAITTISELVDHLKRLYYRVVGAVLQEVMDHPQGATGWRPLDEVVNRLRDDALRQGGLDVFVLNYDALLESRLLESVAQGSGVGVADEFDGRYSRLVLPENSGYSFEAIPWREDSYYPDQPTIHVNHLHGAGSWLMYEDWVYKARRLSDLRSYDLYNRWVQGQPLNVRPQVVLGDQKQNIAGRWPFADAYANLLATARRAQRVVICGYSFRDVPLNRQLRLGLGTESEVIVVSTNSDALSVARNALGLKSHDSRIRHIHAPLPDGLEDF
jgi:hypothetical protein